MLFVGLDGCQLKGPYGGIMLAFVSLDGNNGLFPVVFVIVEVENKDIWSFFLQLLETMIGNAMEDKSFVMMTDRQKGLDQAIAEVFPRAQHRWCYIHLYKNFKAQFPGILLRTLFWRAARTCCEWEFKEAMKDIKKEDSKAFEWLDKIPPAMWSRHAFNPCAKGDHITNIMTKSFNQLVGQLRRKHILTLVESMVVKLMDKIHKVH